MSYCGSGEGRCQTQQLFSGISHWGIIRALSKSIAFFWKALPQNATIHFLKHNQINSLWVQPCKANSIARKQRSLLPKYEQSICAQKSMPVKHLVICTLWNDKLNYGAVCVLSRLHKTSLSIFRKDCFQSSRASNVQIKLLNSSSLLNTGKRLWTTQFKEGFGDTSDGWWQQWKSCDKILMDYTGVSLPALSKLPI